MQKKYIIINTAIITIIATITCFILISHCTGTTPEDEDYNKAFNNAYGLYAPPIPDSLTFCGEAVPIDRYDVREALDRELMVNTYWQSNILLYCKRAYRYFPIIETILQEQGVPEDFKYLALIESGLTNVVSPAKAAGYWQILKSTGINYGLEITEEIDQRYSVEASTLAACKYLKNSYRQHGSWTAAAAAYNMGDGGYRRNASTQHTSCYWDMLLNSETARYVYRILAAKIILSDLPAYGIHLRAKDMYPVLPFHTITIDTSVNNWVNFAIEQGISYKQLKDYNPWIRATQLTNKIGKTYTLKIPDESSYNQLISLMNNKNEIVEKL